METRNREMTPLERLNLELQTIMKIVEQLDTLPALDIQVTFQPLLQPGSFKSFFGAYENIYSCIARGDIGSIKKIFNDDSSIVNYQSEKHDNATPLFSMLYSVVNGRLKERTKQAYIQFVTTTIMNLGPKIKYSLATKKGGDTLAHYAIFHGFHGVCSTMFTNMTKQQFQALSQQKNFYSIPDTKNGHTPSEYAKRKLSIITKQIMNLNHKYTAITELNNEIPLKTTKTKTTPVIKKDVTKKPTLPAEIKKKAFTLKDDVAPEKQLLQDIQNKLNEISDFKKNDLIPFKVTFNEKGLTLTFSNANDAKMNLKKHWGIELKYMSAVNNTIVIDRHQFVLQFFERIYEKESIDDLYSAFNLNIAILSQTAELSPKEIILMDKLKNNTVDRMKHYATSKNTYIATELLSGIEFNQKGLTLRFYDDTDLYAGAGKKALIEILKINVRDITKDWYDQHLIITDHKIIANFLKEFGKVEDVAKFYQNFDLDYQSLVLKTPNENITKNNSLHKVTATLDITKTAKSDKKNIPSKLEMFPSKSDTTTNAADQTEIFLDLINKGLSKHSKFLVFTSQYRGFWAISLNKERLLLRCVHSGAAVHAAKQIENHFGIENQIHYHEISDKYDVDRIAIENHSIIAKFLTELCEIDVNEFYQAFDLDYNSLVSTSPTVTK